MNSTFTQAAEPSRLPPAVKDSLAPFFSALFHPGDGMIELRGLPDIKREFVKPGDFAAVRRFISQYPGKNMFFGVAARRDGSSGKTENCSFVRAVWADIDFKHIPEAEAARALSDFPLRPSLLANSGGGFHVYYLLEEPFDLQRRAEDFKKLLRATARALGADLSSAEPAHILRIPGTLNFKYSPAREVCLV